MKTNFGSLEELVNQKDRWERKFWNKNGNKTEIKLSKIEGCELKSVGELSFDFYHGTCNTFSFGVLLCFDYYSTQSCHM